MIVFDGYQVNTLGGQIRLGELRLTAHSRQHNDLLRYTGLMLWLKKADYGAYHSLKQVSDPKPLPKPQTPQTSQ